MQRGTCTSNEKADSFSKFVSFNMVRDGNHQLLGQIDSNMTISLDKILNAEAEGQYKDIHLWRACTPHFNLLCFSCSSEVANTGAGEPRKRYQ